MATSAVVTAPAVPFLDLRPSHEPLREALLDELGVVIDSGAFTNGPAVARFEEAFAAYCGRSFCVGTASGLDALRLAFVAAGLEPGDEVVVPAQTFVATWEAVTQAGGRPVPADISELDYGLDPEAAAEAVGPRTRFLLPVHLYGQAADLAGLADLAARRGLVLVEDACQAHGARRDSHTVGGVGHAAAFSFYPAKNLGAFGDAGALVSDDPDLVRRVVALREHGQTRKYVHEVEGWTARIDTVQAVVLLQKLALLDAWNDERREAAAYYGDALAGLRLHHDAVHGISWSTALTVTPKSTDEVSGVMVTLSMRRVRPANAATATSVSSATVATGSRVRASTTSA